MAGPNSTRSCLAGRRYVCFDCQILPHAEAVASCGSSSASPLFCWSSASSALVWCCPYGSGASSLANAATSLAAGATVRAEGM